MISAAEIGVPGLPQISSGHSLVSAQYVKKRVSSHGGTGAWDGAGWMDGMDWTDGTDGTGVASGMDGTDGTDGMDGMDGTD